MKTLFWEISKKHLLQSVQFTSFWILQIYKNLPATIDVFLAIFENIFKTLFLRTLLNSRFWALLLKVLTSHPNFSLPTTPSSLLNHVVGQNQHFVFHRKLISWNLEFTFTANLVLVFNKSLMFQRYQLLLNPFIRSKSVDWFLYDNGLID